VSGETSAGRAPAHRLGAARAADVVVLETGANDGLRALRVDSTRANLEAIVERIGRRIRTARDGARADGGAAEPRPAGIRPSFRAMFPAVAEKYGLTLAPFLLDRVAGSTSLNQADGIHPNEAGERNVRPRRFRPDSAPVLDSARAATLVPPGPAGGALTPRPADAQD
jgi:acyl-CoA thioesterase-1